MNQEEELLIRIEELEEDIKKHLEAVDYYKYELERVRPFLKHGKTCFFRDSYWEGRASEPTQQACTCGLFPNMVNKV